MASGCFSHSDKYLRTFVLRLLGQGAFENDWRGPELARALLAVVVDDSDIAESFKSTFKTISFSTTKSSAASIDDGDVGWDETDSNDAEGEGDGADADWDWTELSDWESRRVFNDNEFACPFDD